MASTTASDMEGVSGMASDMDLELEGVSGKVSDLDLELEGVSGQVSPQTDPAQKLSPRVSLTFGHGHYNPLLHTRQKHTYCRLSTKHLSTLRRRMHRIPRQPHRPF